MATTMSLRFHGKQDTEQFKDALGHDYTRLFQATQALDDLAERLGVTKIGAFYCADKVAWHRADDGLRTVTALTGNLELIDRPATGRAALLTELNMLWEVFIHLAGTSATFHFHVGE